jgi:hypothetical protein
MNQQVKQPTAEIPNGYLRDAQGRLVPEDMVEPIDLERNDLVLNLVDQAKALQKEMIKFKAAAFGEIGAFIELSAERYDVKVGGRKGNVSLVSFDGKFKVQRAISEHITFDERLQVARELIYQCIHGWVEGSGSEVRALVEHAFQVDKEGNVSTARIMGLRRINITDAKWQKAMEAIADSIQVSGSKSYVRLYERVGDSEHFKPISLDLAGL